MPNLPEPLRIGGRTLALDAPTYFIADIIAIHPGGGLEGDLERIKALIWRAKEAGAECAKLQPLEAGHIAPDRALEELAATARAAGIHLMTTPNDEDAVASLDALVPAWMIGSGDITWVEFIRKVAGTGKPLLLATGASTLADVDRAVRAALTVNRQLVLMQSNTNSNASTTSTTGALANFRHINLNVLKTYAARYPGLLLGLSDHAPGHATVLGAVALGARVVHKPFTDDHRRAGPDHASAASPDSWHEMVQRCRELEAALGDGIKRVEANEVQTAVLKQRCLRARHDLAAGTLLGIDDLEVLRPAPAGAARPYELASLLGRRLRAARPLGVALSPDDVEPASAATIAATAAIVVKSRLATASAERAEVH